MSSSKVKICQRICRCPFDRVKFFWQRSWWYFLPLRRLFSPAGLVSSDRDSGKCLFLADGLMGVLAIRLVFSPDLQHLQLDRLQPDAHQVFLEA